MNCFEKISHLIRQVFDERILLQDFVHDSSHFCVSQRSQKLILHELLDIYPRITFIKRSVKFSESACVM